MSIKLLFLSILLILGCSQNSTSIVFFGDFSLPQTQVFTGTNFYNFAQNLPSISQKFTITIIPLQLYNTVNCNTTCFINALVYGVISQSNSIGKEQLFWLQCFTNTLYSLNAVYSQSQIIEIAVNCSTTLQNINMNKIIPLTKSFTYQDITNNSIQYLMGNYSSWTNASSLYLTNVKLNQDGSMYFLPFGNSNQWVNNLAQQACLVLEEQLISFPAECAYFNSVF